MPARVFLSRLRGLFTRRHDSRISEEIAAHIDLLARDLERRGLTAADARREAIRQFGGITQTAETWHDQRSVPFLETLARDLLYALRQLRANPGFAAAAVLTLALGIGANTAIFRVLDAVLIRSLPVRVPRQLVLLDGSDNGMHLSLSYPLFREIAARQHVAEGMIAFCDFPMKDAVVPGSTGLLVTGNYFQLLGVDAALGRVITPEDDRPAAAPAAVISYAFWQRAFGGRPDALGRTVRIGKAVVTIIGVAPREFFGTRVGSAPDVWLPVKLAPEVWINFLETPAICVLKVIARLRPGVPVAQAQTALGLLYSQLDQFQVHHAGGDHYRLDLLPGSQGVRDLQTSLSQPLLVLAALVALVLLIACSNLANLLLARATARTQEMGVRLALGAARGRLIRQLLTESLLLAFLGSLLGLALALWASQALATVSISGKQVSLPIEMGGRSLAFTAMIASLAVGFFGLAPALHATRLDVHAALHSSSRSRSRSRAQNRTARTLVALQVAVSLLLVAGASLLVRSFWNLLHQDFGYRHQGVLWVRTPFDISARSQVQLLPAVLDRLNETPGVLSAALAATGPLGDMISPGGLSLPGRPAGDQNEAVYVGVTPRFFETMGIRILAGRPITSDDRQGTARVAVISETAARRLFGTADPIGRTFARGMTFVPEKPVEIVGVASDIRFSDPQDPFRPVIYQPFAQEPKPSSSLMLRTAGDPAALTGAVRQAIREAAPALRIGEIRPLTEIIGASLGTERGLAILSGAFGLLALVLASVGLYGVIAYAVQTRKQEIGIRIALGARGGEVIGLLLREVATVLATGLAIGGVAAMALGRFLKTLLFGLTPYDPAMLIGAALLLSAVALVAGYLPARRAARVDPLCALRQS